MAINPGLMEELRIKYGVGTRQVQNVIKRLVDESGDTISREDAALVLAAEKGVKISRYASQEERDRVRVIRHERSLRSIPAPPKKIDSPAKEKPPRIIQIGKRLKVKDPFLSTRIHNEAERMSEIYGLVYLFENSVRNIITIVLENKYGANWWESRVSIPIKKSVRDKIAKEDKKPWHGRRGQHEIFYTEIRDLIRIINNNWEDFEPILRDFDIIKQLIGMIETSRHVIAHNNPLAKHDINRLEINFQDWMRTITEAREQIEEIRSITT